MPLAFTVWLIVVLILIFCYVVRINSKLNELLRRQAPTQEPVSGGEEDAKRPA